MDRFAVALLLVLGCAVPASAGELPARKAGLWEMKTTTSSGRALQMQQCVDAQTDGATQAKANSDSEARGCSKRDVKKAGDTFTVDSTCTQAGKTRTNHTVITGSFDSGYTMVITAQSEEAPAGRTITVEAKWLGPCAADQKPGDTIMPDGKKMNVLEMQKRMGQPAAPAVPGASPTH